MFRRLLDVRQVCSVISIFAGAEAAATPSSRYLALAEGNLWTSSVGGASSVTLTVARGPHQA